MNKRDHLEELITKQSHNLRNTDIELKWNDHKSKNGMLENNGT